MPNVLGRIDLDGCTAACHDPQRIQGFTAFGANPYRGSYPARPEIKFAETGYRQSSQLLAVKAEAKERSTKRRPSTPQEFLVHYRNRLLEQQANKALDAASWQDVDRISAGMKANCAPAIAPGGVGPMAGTSWATWDGIARRKPPEEPVPTEDQPQEPPAAINKDGTFLEVATSANCAPAILAVPKGGVGSWAGSSPQTMERLSEIGKKRPQSAAAGPAALRRPSSATTLRRPQSSAQRPSSAASTRPMPSAAKQRPSSAATLRVSHQGYAPAAGVRPRKGQQQEMFGAVLLDRPQSGKSAWG